MKILSFNWKLSPPTSNIYSRSGSFNFSSYCIIKTTEEAIPLFEGYETFHLFSKKLIRAHQKKYKFLHVGMIQVALKPTTRLG